MVGLKPDAFDGVRKGRTVFVGGVVGMQMGRAMRRDSMCGDANILKYIHGSMEWNCMVRTWSEKASGSGMKVELSGSEALRGNFLLGHVTRHALQRIPILRIHFNHNIPQHFEDSEIIPITEYGKLAFGSYDRVKHITSAARFCTNVTPSTTTKPSIFSLLSM